MSDMRDVARLMGNVVEETSDRRSEPSAEEAWDACVAWFARLSGPEKVRGTLLLEAEEANPWRR